MDFKDQIKQLGDRVTKLKEQIQTEEATKNAFIMPFLQSLGYDVFNPLEVVPEYITDIGTKKGEKIDYAIFKDGMYTNKLKLMRDKGQVSDAINATRTDASLAAGAGLPKKQGEDKQGDTVPEGPAAASAPGSSAVSSRVALTTPVAPQGTVTSSSLPAGVR